MKSIIFFLGIVAALAISFVLVGFCSPIEQSTEYSKEFSCSKDELWQKITDFDLFSEYKNDVAKIEIKDGIGREWKEYKKVGGFLEFTILEEIIGERLVLKIFDSELGIETKRIYKIYGDTENSMLSITEEKRVEKVLLRSTLAISGGGKNIQKELDNLKSLINYN